MRISSGNLSDFAAQRLRMVGDTALINENRPWFLALDALRREMHEKGQQLTSFATYDYLGLGTDPRVRAAASEALATHGPGAGASRLVGGERLIHRALERDIADFLKVEDALVLVSGYLTNTSVLTHLLLSQDAMIVDELSHNSIMIGADASRATKLKFRHNDLAHLEQILKDNRSHFKRCAIVVEGLYSMDGDFPDLRELVRIKNEYHCWLILDEAHSIGVLGENGRGLSEEYGVDPAEIDLIIGTLSKTFVSCGGFIGGRTSAITWLRYSLPGFVFSVGMPPVIAAAARAALAVLREEPWRVAKLRDNGTKFLASAQEHGLNAGSATGRGVVPLIMPDTATTMEVARVLLTFGIYCPPIVQIGVPHNQPRLRFFLSAGHDPAKIAAVAPLIAQTLEDLRRHPKAEASLALGL
jgi:8-amino-7-oxononanoate synthase